MGNVHSSGKYETRDAEGIAHGEEQKPVLLCPRTKPERQRAKSNSTFPGSSSDDEFFQLDTTALSTNLRADTTEQKKLSSPGLVSSHLRAGRSHRSDVSSNCSFTFPTLTGGNGSLKVVPEKQPLRQKYPQAAAVESCRQTPKLPQGKWLLCFSCSICRAD